MKNMIFEESTEYKDWCDKCDKPIYDIVCECEAYRLNKEEFDRVFRELSRRTEETRPKRDT